MRVKLTLLALLCALIIPAVSLAQETGSVSGAVFERTGTPVPGATVKISGASMPTPRSTVTSENGLYRFEALLPGSYTIDIEKTGIGKTTRAIEVSVSRDLQADFILGALSEQVTVSAVASQVDVKS